MVNKAIAFRLLSALSDMGYVRQDPLSGRYEATFKVAALGLRKLDAARLGEWAQLILDDLASETRELVRLAVGEGSTLRWIAKSQGSNSRLILDPAAGADVVLHATASGKVWLSTFDIDEAMAIVAAQGTVVRTPHTHTDLGIIRQELLEAGQRGYATTLEEMDEGVNAIAAPIRISGNDGRRHAVGTLSVAGPAQRIGPTALEGFAPALLRAAQELANVWPVYLHVEAQAQSGRIEPLASGSTAGRG